MAQTAAHLVDHVIPPVPVRQWVISVPKRLRCFLADRPNAVAALTRIFIEEIERLLCTAAGPTRAGDRPSVARPRLGAVSFLHRFGSALNHHVHLHACATDGVFVPTGGGPPAFLPARPIIQADLATLTEKVRRRVVRWFRMQRLIDADAASDMLRWENRRPLRAPPTLGHHLGSQLGWPGTRAEVHTAGRQRRRRAFPI
ncbi:MAG: transposase [Planctomycetota bacterium]